ncbi:zinc ABC transporter substrate-binding protein [Oceanospirillum sp. D5]|uniref:Zinc ABC transporter substrate-binding protein n=2 Tax=Oceanospirillum sediminis TaxID=2760088 RepID=A0A839IRX9_9GAMM|nr:zinc ABC transporter substrate-binding protein [Oceanospirillum sediminis]
MFSLSQGAACWRAGKVALAGFGLLFSLSAGAADKVRVVATFSVLGDLVREIGGDNVDLATLVGANSDAHVFQPSPRDAGAVSKADLVILNGLGFEGWIERLLESAHYKGAQVVATSGIRALKSGEAGHQDEHDDHHDDHASEHKDHDDHHDDHASEHKDHADHHGHHHGEWDPHAWHDIDNVVVYVKNIANGLSEADPANKAEYQKNAQAYIKELEQLEHEIEHLFDEIPEQQRKVITPHDAFGYFAHAWHIEFIAPQGNSTESEAAAGDVAKIIRQIREHQIRAVFIENVSDSRLIEQISRETGAVIGGSLYSDALSASNGPAGTYLKMMRHNAHTLADALNQTD